MSEGDKGFEVKDRRKAREALGGSGETAPGGEKPEYAGTGPDTTAREGGPVGAGGDTASKPDAERARAPKGEPPPIDFIAFIGSLAATAYFHLGEKLSPDQPEAAVDLLAAKQMIDLIDLMKAKTSGNLEKEEADTLEHILYNLRMRYVQETNRR